MSRTLPSLVVLLWPLLAGWTQYHTNEAHLCGLRWYGGAALSAPAAVTLQIDEGGLDGVSGAGLLAITQMALDQWRAVSCADLDPKAAPLPLDLQVGAQGKPTPTGAGCSDPPGATAGCKIKNSNGNFIQVVHKTSDWSYGGSVFALTVLTYNTCTGEIVDGDILLDDAGHDFCAETCKPGQQSLGNTITHEIGHLLGLDHSQAEDSTMYASAPAGETKKATLHGDDRQALCHAYTNGCGRGFDCATAALPSVAAAPRATEGGCRTQQVAGRPPWVLALLCGALWVVWRKRGGLPCTSK